MPPRYIDIPGSDMIMFLEGVGKSIESAGGEYARGTAGAEVTYDFYIPKSHSIIRVFTSLPVNARSVRDVGEDAIRLVIGTEHRGQFKPISASQRVYRTAPNNTTDRVQAFFDRFRQILRERYKEATTATWTCSKCKGTMVIRTNRQTGGQFWGCLNYPECRNMSPIGG